MYKQWKRIVCRQDDDEIVSFQKDTACTRLEYCRHLLKVCLHNPCYQRWGPDSVFGKAGCRSLPPGWFSTSQKQGTSSQILARRHKHTPVIWICNLCHKQINKQQKSTDAPNTHYNKTGTHSRTIGKQTGHNSLQTPRLLYLTFNNHQIYTLQTPSSQTSFSMQTKTTSQRTRYTPHANYFQNS